VLHYVQGTVNALHSFMLKAKKSLKEKYYQKKQSSVYLKHFIFRQASFQYNLEIFCLPYIFMTYFTTGLIVFIKGFNCDVILDVNLSSLMP